MPGSIRTKLANCYPYQDTTIERFINMNFFLGIWETRLFSKGEIITTGWDITRIFFLETGADMKEQVIDLQGKETRFM